MARPIFSLLTLFVLAAPAPAQQTPPSDSPFGRRLVARKPDVRPAHVVHRLGTPRLFQPGGIAGIAVSPDGKWMATGDRGMTNQVYVWDLKTGAPKWILQGHVQWIARLEFSADGEYLLVSHHDDTFHDATPPEMVVWKVGTGTVAKYYQPTDWSLARDGRTLAIGRPNFYSDNRTPVIRSKGFTVDVVDFPSFKRRRSITHPTKLIHAVALAPDGSTLAVGTAHEILLYDTATGNNLPGIQGLKDRVHLLRFSPDGKTLASVGDDLFSDNMPRSVELWDVQTGKRTGTLAVGRGSPFRRLEFLPDGRLLTQRFLGESQLWNLATRQVSRTFKAGAVALFNDGKSVAHNDDPKNRAAGRIYLEDLATGKLLAMQRPNAPLLPWKFSDDGRIIFTRTQEKPGRDELVQAWEVATGQEIAGRRRTANFPKPPTLMEKPNRTLGDGREIRYKWKEHTFSIVDTKTAKELYRHQVTGFPAWRVSPDQKRLAVFENTADRRIRIIDLATFRDIASIPVAVSQSVHEYRFTPDGANLAVTEYLGTMRLYDVTTGRLRLERGPVGHVVFSPDGRTMAAGNLAGTVDVVELRE